MEVSSELSHEHAIGDRILKYLKKMVILTLCHSNVFHDIDIQSVPKRSESSFSERKDSVKNSKTRTLQKCRGYSSF